MKEETRFGDRLDVAEERNVVPPKVHIKNTY